jgi:glycosyltransferase involved in cell wall biosynthesis
MSAAKISIDVVIPVYNGQDYIAEAVQSVLEQTFLPTNLIIVNDGSTDQTREILEEIKSKNNTSVTITILDQENKGLSAARNAGILFSKAAYIAFLDADDRWLPSKLEMQLDVFQSTSLKNAGVVYCNYKVIDENGNDSSSEVIAIRKENRGNIFKEISKGNLVSGSGSGVLVKRVCFEKAGMFDEQLKAYEDWDMWLRIAKEFEFDYSETVLVAIRRHSKSMQQNASHMNKNAFLFYKKWLPVINDKEALNHWAFHIAKPVYIYGYKPQYLKEIRSVFTGEELSKLFSRTFGSIGLYIFLKRMSGNKYRPGEK